MSRKEEFINSIKVHFGYSLSTSKNEFLDEFISGVKSFINPFLTTAISIILLIFLIPSKLTESYIFNAVIIVLLNVALWFYYYYSLYIN